MAAIGVDCTGGEAHGVFVSDRGAVERTRTVSGTAAQSVRDAALAVAGTSTGRIDLPLGIAAGGADRDASEVLLRDLAQTTGFVCDPGGAAVAAEVWIGAAKGARHAVCLWLGDRVLAGVLLDGKPWAGAHGLAGSAAWLALNPVERQDYRKYGGFAAEINGQGIARRLTWRVQAGDDSSVAPPGADLAGIGAPDVFGGARQGDGVAISVVRDTARYIAMAAVNLAIAVDPEVVVIGGPITAAQDLLLEHTRQDFDRRLPPSMVGHVRCEFSPLGRDGIAIGAARLAMRAKS
jgi:glucokinase